MRNKKLWAIILLVAMLLGNLPIIAAADGYAYLSSEQLTLTAYAESWQGDSVASNVVDNNTETQWHSKYNGAETNDNHIPEDANGNDSLGNDTPMAKYNNLYLVLSKPTTVENIFIQAKWSDGITNGTAKQVKVYVSSDDYTTNKNIEWGNAVGSSPESGFTYKNAKDTIKYVEFDKATENVKSVRIEFTHTYSQYREKENQWIRVVEAGSNATIPESKEYPPLPNEQPLYTIAALADIHTDYGLEKSESHIRETATTVINAIKENENLNAIVVLGDLFSSNDNAAKPWGIENATERKELYNTVVNAAYTTMESGMANPKVMYIAGNHEGEIGLKDFNSQSFVADGTERTMGKMVAASNVTDTSANAYFQSNMDAVLNDSDGARNVLAYHYNVDGLD